MDSLPLPLFDLAVFGIVLVSALFAMLRGFTHEVLSILGWVAAALAVIFGLPVLRPFARAMVSTAWIADAAAAVVLFLATLILSAIITRSLSHGVKGSALSPVDRALGFAFGALRGGFIIVLTYLAMLWVLDLSSPPQWMRGGKTTPWITTAAEVLKRWMPDSLFETEIGRQAETTKTTAKQAMEIERTVKSWSAPTPKAKAQPDQEQPQGYADDQRRDMNRLIDANR